MANLLRIIHTMRPPGQKKKKKRKKGKDSEDAISAPLDPHLKERVKRFPGLALPDNHDYVQTLLQEVKEEVEESKDTHVVNEAMNEVSV